MAHVTAPSPWVTCTILVAAAAAAGAAPEGRKAAADPADLKKLTLEELMQVEVTLVSRGPETLGEAASAIQVITREDIRRSGAATLAEALRLAGNLHVARLASSAYAISARGMNSTTNTLANKLLVMIDGRTVYTPLYAGVFWDVQHVILDNVERIEVVSGPGGSVWGSNAVNGVINIVTREAGKTRGAFVEAGGGTFLRDFVSARFGGRLGGDFDWRVFGQRIDHGGSVLGDSGGAYAEDEWDFTRGGMRADWAASGRDKLVLQGELAGAGIDQQAPSRDTDEYNMQMLQARWTRVLSPTSEIAAKAYAERTWRSIPAILVEDLRTLDVDAFHSFSPFAGNRLLWGGGYRLHVDDVTNPDPAPGSVAFVPARKRLHLASLYLEDHHHLLDDRLQITAGGRLERNVYTGWEAMPTARASWSFLPGRTLWAAWSRAVRSPSRVDVESFQPPPELVSDTTPIAVLGGPDFRAEILNAYELGCRSAFGELAAVSASAFAHSYEGLRILEETAPGRLQFTNGMRGEIYGLELAGDLRALPAWRLRGGYTAMLRDLYPIRGHVAFPQPGSLGNDPAWHAQVQSFADLPGGLELNGAARWVDALPAPRAPAYFTFDLGAAWRWKDLEVSIHGRDLAQASHREAKAVDDPRFPAQDIPRSVHGRIAWRM